MVQRAAKTFIQAYPTQGYNNNNNKKSTNKNNKKGTNLNNKTKEQGWRQNKEQLVDPPIAFLTSVNIQSQNCNK